MDNKTSIILSATDKTAGAFKSAQKNLDGLSGSMSKFNSLLAGVGLGVSAQTIGKMADDYSNLQSRLKLASRSTQEFAAANEAVQRIAAASQSPLLETATLYTRIAASLKDTAVSQEEMVGTTEAVALALRISGASAAESSSAMLQFSQAMASGVLRGEEFNAVNESAPRLMQALAKSLGVGVGALRDMAKEGQLTREVLINGLANELPTLRREAETLPKTFGAAFTELNNTLLLTIGRINEASGASGVLAKTFSDVGNPLITKTIETLGIVVANTSFVFKVLANDAITSLTAIGYSMTLQFGMAKKALDNAAVYAKNERKNLDELEKRILNPNSSIAEKSTNQTTYNQIKQLTQKNKSAKPKDRMSDTEWAMEETAHLTRTLYQIGEQMDEASAAAFERAAESAEAWQSGLDAANETLRQAAQGYVDLIDPVERYRRQLEEIRQLAEAGLLTKEQATEAEFAIQQQIDAAAGFGEELKKTQSIADELGLTFSSAFEDAIVAGKGLRDILDGIYQDILRIVIRKSVTEPLAAGFSSLLGSVNWAGMLPKFATGTDYVPRDMVAVVHKGERIIPAAQNRPGAGGGVTVNMTVMAQDAGSFRKSMGQIQADLAFAVNGARRFQ